MEVEIEVAVAVVVEGESDADAENGRAPDYKEPKKKMNHDGVNFFFSLYSSRRFGGWANHGCRQRRSGLHLSHSGAHGTGTVT